MFPFLIGTVRTKYQALNSASLEKFPFLIGTVRTEHATKEDNEPKIVSIPHRYGKNWLKEVIIVYSIRVSIPHRYGKNSHINSNRTSKPTCFHSS